MTSEPKPLALRSPDNALAIGLYAGFLIIGTAFLAVPDITRALRALLWGSQPLVQAWAGLLMAASATGGLSALVATRLTRPRSGLLWEARAVGAVAALLGLYVYSLTFSASFPVVTFLIFLVVMLAAVGRVAQLAVELHALKKAQRTPRIASSESLAEHPHGGD